MALLRGTDWDTPSQRGCVGRGKHEEESSCLGLRHRRGRQCFPRPTVWETRCKAVFSKRVVEPRHVKWYCSGFKEKDVILLEITEEILY